MKLKNKKYLFIGFLSLMLAVPLASCSAETTTTATAENQVLITGAKAIEVGETVQLSTVFSVETVDVLWASLTPNVATVDSSGLVTGLEEGTAIIVVQSNTDAELRDSVEIEVTRPLVPEAEYVKALFYDYDGTLLDEDIVEVGGTPRYTGDNPTRLSDSANSYTFIGWDKEITAISVDTEYTAQYEATPLSDFTFSIDITNGGYAVDGYTGSSTDIVIPSSYNYRNVVSISAQAFYYNTSITSVTLPDTIKSIGASAFYYCYNMVSCNLPSGLKSIGASAFYYCESLEGSYEFDETLTEVPTNAFYNCSNLRYFSAPGLKTIGASAFANCYVLNFKFNEGLESIGAFAFQWNRALRTVVLPSTVTYLGESVFCHAQGITSLTLPENLETIDYSSTGYQSLVLDCINLSTISISENNPNFKVVNNGLYSKDGTILYAVPLNYGGSLTIEDGCTTIQGTVFYEAYYSTVTIPNTVKTVGQYAFWLAEVDEVVFEEIEEGDTTTISFSSSTFYQSNLMYLTLNGAVTTLPMYFAAYSYYLKEVANADSVVTIGNYAFQNCYSLRSINLANTTTINMYAFYNSDIESVTIPSTVSSIGTSAFSGTSNLTTVTFDDAENSQLSTLGAFAFSSSGITSFTMPDSITSLSNGSIFRYCEDLEEVYISKNVTTLGNYIFSDCSSLDTVTFGYDTDPDTDAEIYRLTTINQYAFQNSGLTSFTMPDSVTTLATGGNTFAGSTSLEEIYISKNVTSIPNYCFSNCTSLKTITFGPGVENSENDTWSITISSSAFNNCVSVEQINFMGTEAQWNSLLNANSTFSSTITALIGAGQLNVTYNYDPDNPDGGADPGTPEQGGNQDNNGNEGGE